MSAARHDPDAQRLPVVLRRIDLVGTHDQDGRGIRERRPNRATARSSTECPLN